MGQNGNGKLPYFPMYPTDFLSDDKVQLMDGWQKGLYALLIFHAWLQHSPGTLPSDDGKLAKLLGLSLKQWMKEKDAVMLPFTLVGDHWEQKRLVSEYRKARGLQEVRIKAGRKGGCSKAKAELQQSLSKIEAELKQNLSKPLARASDSGSLSLEEKEKGRGGMGEEPSDLGNLSLPNRPDPNRFAPSTRAGTYIDSKKPPFPNTLFWQEPLAQKAVREYLIFAEEKFGWRRTDREFGTLVLDLEREMPTPQAILKAVRQTIRKGWKHIHLPSETGEKV